MLGLKRLHDGPRCGIGAPIANSFHVGFRERGPDLLAAHSLKPLLYEVCMNGNPKGHAPTIDVRIKEELEWWTTELDTSEDQLRGAISQVGDSADAVREALKKSPAGAGSAQRPTNDRTADGVIVSPMVEAWERAQAVAASVRARRRQEAFGRAVPWVLGVAAVAVLAMVARKLTRS